MEHSLKISIALLLIIVTLSACASPPLKSGIQTNPAYRDNIVKCKNIVIITDVCLQQDALKGDQTLFVSAEETELSWEKIEPYLDMGNPELYRRGKIPASDLDADWVDMTKYVGRCNS